MLIILYEKLTYHFLYIAISIQTNVFTFIVYGIAVTIFLTFLCDGLVQLQLIPQVHYVNNATSYKNNSHAIHNILICVETPTYHFSYLYSVLRFSSRLSFLCICTTPRTDPDDSRLTVTA